MDINSISGHIVQCAIEVHRHLGPGLLESAYEAALAHEFHEQGVNFRRQHPVTAIYKGVNVGTFFLDFLVEDRVVVEVKSTRKVDGLTESQILTYMRLSKCQIGLLLNFYERTMLAGVKRLINPNPCPRSHFFTHTNTERPGPRHSAS